MNIKQKVAAGTLLVALFTSTEARAQAQDSDSAEAPAAGANLLEQFSGAVEAMVRRVSPTVVQILATRYGINDQGGRSSVAAGMEQSVGSGVIIAADGYIMTNAHVIQNAHDIRIRLVPSGKQTIGAVLSESFSPTVDAVLIGTYTDADLALLKISAEDLPSLRMAGPGTVRQGQVTFAFGSPSGLQNSVTMGVVSSIARQLEPDDPLLYIQTDTAINPGNSGGPLVNTSGEMVGLNTFISTQSGGSEGMGFAIPAVLVNWVYQQLRKNGHVHRPVIGAGLQTITPPMAAALKLPRDKGVIVSDLLADSPAAVAGVKLNDILLSVNDRPMDNVAGWIGLAFQHVPGSAMSVKVLRGTRTLSFSIVPVDMEQPSERLADLVGISKSQVPQLGIMAVTFDERTATVIGSVRLASGAVAIARIATPDAATADLRPGDLIHEINGKNVFSVEDLKNVLAGLKHGDAVALFVERAQQWSYIAFNLP